MIRAVTNVLVEVLRIVMEDAQRVTMTKMDHAAVKWLLIHFSFRFVAAEMMKGRSCNIIHTAPRC